MSGGTAAPARPVLAGRTVTLRPGHPGDAGLLRAILAEPSVSRWWGDPPPAEELEASLRSDGPTVLLVVEIDGEVAGGIQYDEEDDPQYRHARIVAMSSKSPTAPISMSNVVRSSPPVICSAR